MPEVPELEGLLLIDKPSGPTSHDVVGRVRALLRTRRVGHAGTLDPMATGLLVVAVGRATKLLGHLALTDKSYSATIRFGETTTTDDADGEIVGSTDVSAVTAEMVHASMAELTGVIEQVPSSVSAIKVNGQRAYARVRAGEDVALAARPVTVSRFVATSDLRAVGTGVEVDVMVDCGTGTYVRALARDLGVSLEVGGHLTRLRRTRVGPFDVGDAVDVFPDGVVPRGAPRPEIQESWREVAARAVIPVSEVARMAFPVRTVTDAEARELRHGRPLASGCHDGVYACCDPAGELVALVADREGAARIVLGWQSAG